LATASSSPVYNHNNSSNNNNHLLKQPVSQAQWRSKLAKSRQFGEERIQSNPHASSPTTKTTSESKNELLEPEELEVVVKALVDDLGSEIQKICRGMQLQN
jgi:ABC-type Na+ efflux pump permease subunit